jgi:hypothetical protein
MHREELRKLLRDRPFRPFRVYTTDDTEIPVWHPDSAYLSPDGRTLFVYQRDYDFNMLDVALIPRFAFDNAPGAKESGNGTAPPPSSA